MTNNKEIRNKAGNLPSMIYGKKEINEIIKALEIEISESKQEIEKIKQTEIDIVISEDKIFYLERKIIELESDIKYFNNLLTDVDRNKKVIEYLSDNEIKIIKSKPNFNKEDFNLTEMNLAIFTRLFKRKIEDPNNPLWFSQKHKNRMVRILQNVKSTKYLRIKYTPTTSRVIILLIKMNVMKYNNSKKQKIISTVIKNQKKIYAKNKGNAQALNRIHSNIKMLTDLKEFYGGN